MKDIKNKTDADLHGMIAEKREVLRGFRFNIAGGKAKNLKEAKAVRKEIAQMLTEANARKTKAQA